MTIAAAAHFASRSRMTGIVKNISAPMASSSSSKKPNYTMYRDLKPIKRPRLQKVVGRFTTGVENFHGRLAMLGMTGCTVGEQMFHIPILQQLSNETNLTAIQIIAGVAFITNLFILETFNPATTVIEEPELDIFTKPGFTLETEILHGRMAMLAFFYTVLSEVLYKSLVL